MTRKFGWDFWNLTSYALNDQAYILIREALPALVALVGLLPGVQAHVLDQVMLVFKRLFADATLVGPFT